MNLKEELAAYDRLLSELRAGAAGTTYRVPGAKDILTPRGSKEIVADMVRHCRACFRRYEARRGHPSYDQYRASLWLLRWWLHKEGLHDPAYQQRSPVGWRRAYEQAGGKTP